MGIGSIKGAALVFAMVAVLLVGVSPAKAGNPVHWSFDVSTSGEDVPWTSPTFVDSWPQYNYQYTITTLEAEIDLIFGTEWVDLTPLVPAENLTGTGTVSGPPPAVLADVHFTYPDTPPYNVAADVKVSVDASGYGHVDFTNIVLGVDPLFGFDILTLHAAGDIDVTGVPEPASIMLLACGALAFVARRSRR